MARVQVGCVGWSYPEWVGSFYPPRAEASDYLTLYARVFDVVEVDSSFYSIPSQDMTRAWLESTPDGFLFTAKFPRLITHEKQFVNVEDPIRWFFGAMSILKPKLGPLVMQLPPRFSIGTGRQALEAFVDQLPTGYRYAIEFRNRSWFTPETFQWLEDRGIALCWSENDYVEVPPVVTTDYVYLRFIGDRSLPKLTGEIQKDRTAEIRKWHAEVKKVQDSVTAAYVFFNNHFAGFGPASVNLWREIDGQERLDWALKMKEEGQKSLFDFA
ncbi:MAG TPA: DUF72 domain-containing protein [Thermoplasmata archaeon]|nr:DUF72 domain-containing protein [Thermoplasmata archaeon]